MRIAAILFFCFMRSHASELTRENVVGGIQAKKGDFPYMAALFQKDENSGYSFVCSGSIIADKWILTAARCTYDAKGTESGTLRPDDCNVASVSVGEAYATSRSKMHTVRKCHRLPTYNNTFYPMKFIDIALLELDEELAWTPFVSPIRLGPLHKKNRENNVFAAGYGLESEDERNNPNSDNRPLTYITLKTVSFQKCNEWDTIKRGNHICAWSRVYGGTCLGDAGGPLVDPKTAKQVGITAFSIECTGRTPSVFMRVSYFLPWIEVATGLKF